MTENERLSLATMKGGAVVEQFDAAMQHLLENVLDPNTKATAARTITLKVKVKPDEERELLGLAASVTTSLAPVVEVTAKAWLAHTRDGVVAMEHDPRQPSLYDEPTEPVPLKAVREGGDE